MQTVIVYTKSVQAGKGKVNQEVKTEPVDMDLGCLQGLKDYIVDKDGKLLKVIEKIANVQSNELRIVVREA